MAGKPIISYAINIQTSRQTKNSLYALVFGQNPLCHFTILKEIKNQYINSEDELSKNWFEPSEPRDNFDRQEVVESLLGAAALNIENKLENELDDEIMNAILDDMNDKMLDNMTDERLDKRLNKRINKKLGEKLNEMISNNESILTEVLEDELVGRSLLEDEIAGRSLSENEAVGKRLSENVLDVYPSKRYKSTILMAINTGINTQ
ncbi:12690_t:CDS:2, partial [Racocetra persica]